MAYKLRVGLLLALASWGHFAAAESISASPFAASPRAANQAQALRSTPSKMPATTTTKKTSSKQPAPNKRPTTQAAKKAEPKLILPTSKKRKPPQVLTISQLRAGAKYGPKTKPDIQSSRTGPNMNLYPSSEVIHNYANKAQFNANVFTVGAHGALLDVPYKVDANGNVIETRQVYYMVVQSKWTNKMACHATC